MINLIAPHWMETKLVDCRRSNVCCLADSLCSLFLSPFLYCNDFSFSRTIFPSCRPEYRAKIDKSNWKFWDLFICWWFCPFISIRMYLAIYCKVFHLNLMIWCSNLYWFFLWIIKSFCDSCGLTQFFLAVNHTRCCLVTNENTSELRERARVITQVGEVVTLLTFILAGVWLYFKEGFIVTSVLDHNAPSDPTVKTVVVEVGASLRIILMHLCCLFFQH